MSAASCGVESVRAVVVTMDSPSANEAVVETTRSIRRDVTLVARARDAAYARALYGLGVTDAVPYPRWRGNKPSAVLAPIGPHPSEGCSDGPVSRTTGAAAAADSVDWGKRTISSCWLAAAIPAVGNEVGLRKVACCVLVSFRRCRYPALMHADELTPADPSDLADALAYALPGPEARAQRR